MGPVATPPPTGDLTQNVPDLQTRMQQYLAMTQRVYGGMKQPEYNQEELHQRPNMLARMLADVGTFGLQEQAWAQRDIARSQYNSKVQQHNAEMDYRAFAEAQKLMQADTNAQMAQAHFGLQQQHSSLEMLRAQAAESDRQLNNYMKQLQARRMQQQIDMDTPFSGGALATPDAMPPSTGGTYEPPAPGSPLADLGDEDAPSAPTTAPTTPTAGAAAPSTIRPGETPREFAARRKADDAAARKESATTSATKTMAEAAPKVLYFVKKIEDSLPDVNRSFIGRQARSFATGTLGMEDQPWTRYRTNVSLLQKLLLRMHVGARGGDKMLSEFIKLINEKAQSPENMAEILQQIKEYANVAAETHGTKTTTPTTMTTTTTAEPGVGTDDDVEATFKKHGY